MTLRKRGIEVPLPAKYEALREKAKKATPGPWKTHICNSGEQCWCRLVVLDWTQDPNENGCVIPDGSAWKEDSEHIAACDPDTILELLSDLEEAVDGLDFTTKALGNFHPFNGDLPKGLDPTMYQTGSYEGDLSILGEFLRARAFLQKVKGVGE